MVTEIKPRKLAPALLIERMSVLSGEEVKSTQPPKEERLTFVEKLELGMEQQQISSAMLQGLVMLLPSTTQDQPFTLEISDR